MGRTPFLTLFHFFTLWPSRFLSLFILICLSCLSSECQRYGVLPATLPLCTLGSSSKTNGSGARSPLLPWNLPSPLQHPLLQWGPPWLWQPSIVLPPHTWVVIQVEPFKLRGTITIKNLKFYICIHTHTHTHIMEYYSVIKNEILPFSGTWMGLEMIKFSEVSQKEKDKYHIISFICGI